MNWFDANLMGGVSVGQKQCFVASRKGHSGNVRVEYL